MPTQTNFNHGIHEAAVTAATMVATTVARSKRMTATVATAGIDTHNIQLKAAVEAVAAEILMAMVTATTVATVMVTAAVLMMMMAAAAAASTTVASTMMAMATVIVGGTDNNQILKRGKRSDSGCSCGGKDGDDDNNNDGGSNDRESDRDGDPRHLMDAMVKVCLYWPLKYSEFKNLEL